MEVLVLDHRVKGEQDWELTINPPHPPPHGPAQGLFPDAQPPLSGFGTALPPFSCDQAAEHLDVLELMEKLQGSPCFNPIM